MLKNDADKSNYFSRVVKHFCVDENITPKKLAEKLNIPLNPFYALINLKYIDERYFGKLIKYMNVTDEQENAINELVNGVKKRTRSLSLYNFPDEIAEILSMIADNYKDLSTQDIKKLIKLVS